jgi:cation diffusion facilitator CzcD-associated flavoprotein CzcO
MRVAVIGCGAAGLAAGRRLADSEHTFVIYEQTGNIGGTWVFTDRVGTDDNGLPVHTSMYKGLRSVKCP